MAKSPLLISVIIPVYNVKQSLRRCFESVAQQNYSSLDIILVDDGSTDGSEKLCDELAKQDKRVRVIHQKNQGLSAARNAGLAVMRGEYVTFVDSDDAVTKDLVNSLLQCCEKQKVKLAIASFAEVMPNGWRKDFCAQNAEIEMLDCQTALKRMLCEEGFTMSAWGKLYHVDLFRDIRFPVGKLYEDVGTTYRAVLQCQRVAFLPLAKYDYYQNNTSIIHQDFSSQKLDLITLTDEMCDEILGQLQGEMTAELSDALRKRRMHARFSILRQMILAPASERQRFAQKEKQVIQYLKQHRANILQNPLSTKRDLLAMCTLLLGLPVFKFAWQYYIWRRTKS